MAHKNRPWSPFEPDPDTLVPQDVDEFLVDTLERDPNLTDEEWTARYLQGVEFLDDDTDEKQQ